MNHFQRKVEEQEDKDEKHTEETEENHVLSKPHVMIGWNSKHKGCWQHCCAERSWGHHQRVTPACWLSQPTKLVNVSEHRLQTGSRREVSQLQEALEQLLRWALVSQFCFLYLFMIQSASSIALLIICWILSGLSSSE